MYIPGSRKITWLEDGIPADEVLCEIGRLQGFSEEKLQHLLERFRHSLENPTVRNALSRSTYADKTLKDEAARDNLSCVHLLSHNDLNSPRWEVRQELPFAVDDGEGILAGAIDRLVILYDGDRPVGADIIDFKTDAVSLERPEGIENRVDVYRPANRGLPPGGGRTDRLAGGSYLGTAAVFRSRMLAEAVGWIDI